MLLTRGPGTAGAYLAVVNNQKTVKKAVKETTMSGAGLK